VYRIPYLCSAFAHQALELQAESRGPFQSVQMATLESKGNSMRARICKVIAVIAMLSAACQATAIERNRQLSVDESETALHQLWDHYQQAVAQKNTKQLLALYVSDSVPVMGGIAPRSYALMAAANKQPVPRTFLVTARENVTGEVKLPPDKTKNLSIHTDGEVGSVSFDYAAKMGHGRIIWSAVRTNEGWKIASVLYSINIPAADKKRS
jgi:hypothetical protein